MKNILIIDDDVGTSLKYKKWLEEEDINLTLINDPDITEQNFKPGKYCSSYWFQNGAKGVIHGSVSNLSMVLICGLTLIITITHYYY